MKKIIISVVLFLSLSSSVSAAFLGLNYDEWNTTLSFSMVGTLYAAQGLYYYMRDGIKSAVSPSGVVSRSSEAQWIDLTLPTPTVLLKPITAKMDIQKLQEIADKKNIDGTYKYPAVENAIRENFLPPPLQTVTLVDGSKRILGAVTASGQDQCMALSFTRVNEYYVEGVEIYHFTPTEVAYCTSIGQKGTFFRSWMNGGIPVPPEPIRQAKAVPAAVASLTELDGTLNTAYQSELDKMFQDSAYVPVFTDDTTGLPHTPPSPEHVSSPADVAKYNTYGPNPVITSTGSPVITNNPDGTSTRTQTTVITGGTDGTKTTTTTTTTSGPDGTGPIIDTKTEETGSAITPPATGAAYGDGTNFDFGARFSTFMADMKTSGLFSLPGQLLGNIPTGGQSDFNVSFGRMGSTRFDLADYGPAIGIMRTLTLIVFSVAGFRIVTLKGGSG